MDHHDLLEREHRSHLPVTFASVLAVLLSFSTYAQALRQPLQQGWMFAAKGDSALLPAEVPGTIHQDLIRNGLIPDPFRSTFADSVQWVEGRDWTYRCTFTPSEALFKKKHIELSFKGLDTFSEVYLNDRHLGGTNNMFRTWSFPVKELLVDGPNTLEVRFRSPVEEGKSLRQDYGLQLPADNDASSDKVSPYIRKAAYHFGWDWAPRLVTSGIWQPVELVAWEGPRIEDVRLRQLFVGGQVLLAAEVSVEHAVSGMSMAFEVDGQRTIVPVEVSAGSGGLARASLAISDPRLWWPSGSGPQVRYPVRVELLEKGKAGDRWERRIGLRTVVLDQREDSIGRAFTFLVNGRPIFMKGCNLVPPDMLLPRAGDSTWVRLVRDMQRAHMNMVRVWAGGVYPPDAFFEACDTAGILVWQDLQFANWVPWDDPVFRENALAEVREQIERVRHHACMALFCGNNELDVAWKNWGWPTTYALDERDQQRMNASYQAAFEQDLPERVRTLSDIAYVSTSPLSNWGDAEGLDHGTLHYWEVWHGNGTFDRFALNVGRFVSEYGFQSYPDSAMLARYLSPAELRLGSPALSARQKSYKTDTPLWQAIDREIGLVPEGLNGFIEATQEVQALACSEAIWAHRTATPHCMGTLFWQLNDCWPGPSWSVVDHEGNWKPAMYAVQRGYADVVLHLNTSRDRILVLNTSDTFTGGLTWAREDSALTFWTGTFPQNRTTVIDLPLTPGVGAQDITLVDAVGKSVAHLRIHGENVPPEGGR